MAESNNVNIIPEKDKRIIFSTFASDCDPKTPIYSVLPILTGEQRLDLELYKTLSIIWREFILKWYLNISEDQDLPQAMLDLISFICKSISIRLSVEDMEIYLIDTFPRLIIQHIDDINDTKKRINTALSSGKSFEQEFHSLQSHSALHNALSENEYQKIYSRYLITLLWPLNDLNSETERIFSQDLISNILLKNIVENITEPYIIHEIITKILTQITSKRKKNVVAMKNSQRMSDVLLLILFKTIAFFINLFGILMFLFNWLHEFCTKVDKSKFKTVKKNFFTLNIFLIPAAILNLKDKKPHLCSLIDASTTYLQNSSPESFLNRSMYYLLRKYVLNIEIATICASKVNETVFPDNRFFDRKSPPSPEEKFEIERMTRNALIEFVNSFNSIEKLVLGPIKNEEIDGFLFNISDKNVNKHLIYYALDELLVTLCPEVLNSDPEELVRLRLKREEAG